MVSLRHVMHARLLQSCGQLAECACMRAGESQHARAVVLWARLPASQSVNCTLEAGAPLRCWLQKCIVSIRVAKGEPIVAVSTADLRHPIAFASE